MSEIQVESKYKRTPKSKITGHCPTHGIVELGAENQCFKCGHKAVRRYTNDAFTSQLDEYLEQYGEVLDAWIPIIPANKKAKKIYAVIKIGICDYFVSLALLQQYQNIHHTNDRDGIDKLKAHIERFCPRQPSI